jgi:hypothetical protein
MDLTKENNNNNNNGNDGGQNGDGGALVVDSRSLNSSKRNGSSPCIFATEA